MMNCRFNRVLLGACIVATTMASIAQAATVAYWRFEEINRHPDRGGGVESPPAVGEELYTTGTNANHDTTPDSSGNNNRLQTFVSGVGAPSDTSLDWSADVPFATVPQTGDPNLRSVFGEGGGAGNTAPNNDNEDFFTAPGVPINSLNLNSGYTIEASFKTPRLGSFQTIMGKDGPTGRAFTNGSGQLLNPQPAFTGGTTTAPAGSFELCYSPFQMKMLGSNFTDFLTDPGDGNIQDKLVIEIVDDSGDGNIMQNVANPGIHRLVSDNTILADTWYSVAVTNDGTTASLWLTDPSTGQYVLQDTEAVIGAFGGDNNTNAGDGISNSIWTMGRGFLTRFGYNPGRQFQGDIRDWYEGNIDEVRISDVALAPDQFLGVPEPATLSLGLLGLAALLSHRRGK